MNWLMMNLPAAIFILFVFAFGLVVGSFLNVLIARLPFEKSVIWPGSRCFTCLQPLRLADNLPIIGYLRLRGKCRICGATFSSRYLWVELFTGFAFVGLFVAEIMLNVSDAPGLKNAMWGGVPTLDGVGRLLRALVPAGDADRGVGDRPAVQDRAAADHGRRHVRRSGRVDAVAVALAERDVTDIPVSLNLLPWSHPVNEGMIPIGMTLWPVWEPWPLGAGGQLATRLAHGVAPAPRSASPSAAR